MRLQPIHNILILNFLNGTFVRAGPRMALPLYALSLDAQPLAVGMLAATFSIAYGMVTAPSRAW